MMISHKCYIRHLCQTLVAIYLKFVLVIPVKRANYFNIRYISKFTWSDLSLICYFVSEDSYQNYVWHPYVWTFTLRYYLYIKNSEKKRCDFDDLSSSFSLPSISKLSSWISRGTYVFGHFILRRHFMDAKRSILSWSELVEPLLKISIPTFRPLKRFFSWISEPMRTIF